MIFTLVGHQYFILLGDSYLIFKPTSANGSHYATSCFVQKESLENIMGKNISQKQNLPIHSQK